MHSNLYTRRLYCCALLEEAQPIISFHKLKKFDKNTFNEFKHIDLSIVSRSLIKMADIVPMYFHTNPISKMALIVTGIGKVNAASALTYGIEIFNPYEIFNIGLCGSLRTEVHKKGNVVRVSKVAQHDADIGTLDKKFGKSFLETLNLNSEIIYSKIDMDLLEYTQAYLATGDQFVCETSYKEILKKDFDIIDMEGYAIAKVALMHNIRITMLKIISDGADENSGNEFSNIFDLYNTKLQEVLNRI